MPVPVLGERDVKEAEEAQVRGAAAEAVVLAEVGVFKERTIQVSPLVTAIGEAETEPSVRVVTVTVIAALSN